MPPSRTLNANYDIIGSIGAGTCGDVLKGKRKSDGQIVAIKKIKILNKVIGFPSNSINEIKFLRELDHPNIMKLIEVCTENHDTYLIFKYFPYDLYGLLYYSSITFDKLHIRSFSRQMLLGLLACKQKFIIHRDIKPANLLISSSNQLQIADFGLSKDLRQPGIQNRPMTTKVITIWYRPPELLLGANRYGTEIDVWSAACIIYEMITKDVLFKTAIDQEIQQLDIIFRICGTPSDANWPTWKQLPNAAMFINASYKGASLEKYLAAKLPPHYHDCISLLTRMLEMNPEKRITVEEALQHPFLSSPNDELEPEKLSKIVIPDSHQNAIIQNQQQQQYIAMPSYPMIFRPRHQPLPK